MKKFLLVMVLAVLFVGIVHAKTQITLYTSVPSAIVAEVEKAFEKANPDIDVVVWRSGTSKVTAKILAEMKSGGIKADVLWTADPSYYLYLKEKGLLMKYISPESDNIPADFKDKDGYFVGTRIMSVVIAYNTNLLRKSQVVKSWEGLLSSKYSGSIVTASPLYSGTNLVWLYSMIKLYGWDFLEELGDNGLTIVSSNKTVSQELANGSYKVAVVLDYMIRSLKASGSPVDLIYPEANNILIWSPIGIITETKQAEAAKRFVDFVISKEGQEILVNYGSLIPVRSDVAMPAGAPKLEDLLKKSYKIDWYDLRESTDEIKDTFSDIFE
ncbi:ABC transporter substrate-binding protein [Kosmotoga sp.]|uniref:ABC transporter substrate-binding protein n=1 Tax=Kosmotoga sp. TaxID=1955248 RepID=UPI0024AA1381|nr:ABC transporter substrate-binding protein [Kosmotoga sp.]MDI3524085.1 iron(III) transport system substrate-binding protein [Kosmotoga sp.]